MKIHKRTWKDAFEKIAQGEKTFDARLANFECNIGDTLILEEYDPVAKKYTGRKLEKKITFILDTNKQKYWSQSNIKKHGILIVGFK